MNKLLTILLLLVSISVNGQIKLPVKFKFKKAERSIDNYYTDGLLNVHRECHKCGINGDNIQEPFVKSYYPNAKQTKDNLFVEISNIKQDGKKYYIYTVVVPEDKSSITVTSDMDNKYYSDFCKWILKEIRVKRKLGKVWLQSNDE